jgi:hypothetical protein
MTITVKNAGYSDVRTFDAENIKIEDLQYVREPLWTAHSHDSCCAEILYEVDSEIGVEHLRLLKKISGFGDNHWKAVHGKGFKEGDYHWGRIRYAIKLEPKLIKAKIGYYVQPEISDECADDIINNIMEDVKIWKGIKK